MLEMRSNKMAMMLSKMQNQNICLCLERSTKYLRSYQPQEKLY